MEHLVVTTDAHAAGLEVELVYARAALRRAEVRITNIEAELGRVQRGAPETADVQQVPENTADPRPKARR